ncbi:ankyrin repeat-containing protein [Pyrus ussuriensis x Pyrus communis]|uniref:Ankyrin repeat-containing protein n=1 Tax=Pyrus ussuriensis x Pyrus communis TaxID=2448454 RepID=A0A5N5H6U9_9ROSA|nr:ankyrin repeat-containing protein [Pyrus ussuriensis x Pyrus communis]
MAGPDGGITEITLGVEGNPRTSHPLIIGGHGHPATSAAWSIPTQHGSDGQEVNLDQYLPLYRAAFSGNWEEASKFLDNDPSAAKARISYLSMTALHVAASEGHSEFVEKLVKRAPSNVLDMQDEMGFTPLHYAAISGNPRSAKALLMENPKLAQCVDAKGRTPLLLAATFASENKELVWYFLLVTTDEAPGHPFTGAWAANLVNVLIASSFHEISLYLLHLYPELAIAIDQEDCSALYVLARNPSYFLSGSRLSFWESCIYSFLPVEVDSRPPHSVRADVARYHGSIQNLPAIPTPEQYGVLHGLRRILFGAIKRIAPDHFTQLHDAKLSHHCAFELVERICLQLSQRHTSWCFKYLLNSEILCVATVNGIVEIIRTLLEFFPDLIWVCKRSNNQYLLLPSAIELRHEHLFRTVYDKIARSKLMATTLIESGGTILHLAAKLAPLPPLSSISGAALQMQRELQWFKMVEKLVHPYYKESRNKNEETARELFTKKHKALAESGEKWLKDTSNSCMLVATLIATVVFAAAFTRRSQSIFLVFVVSDSIALFSSLTSVLMFLSILTARYVEEEFLESLPKRLIIGLATLFFAIAATMVAFGATLLIVLGKKFNWVSILITFLASFPVTLFALQQLPLFIQMVRSTFGRSMFRP